MKYKNPKLNCYYRCVLCSIPCLFVYLRMRISTWKQYAHGVDEKDVMNTEQNTKHTYEYGDKCI